jgi:tRNA1(Val) A37 N6-methylase TrmN6
LSDGADATADERTSCDAVLGGKLKLRQPVSGHRIGSDAILLAAAADAAKATRIVDVGAGVGAVGLAALTRTYCARATLVEIDPFLAKLAEDNARRNTMQERASVACIDVTSRAQRHAAGLPDGCADLVLSNPPYYAANEVRVSPSPRRARAHVLAPPDRGEPSLAVWIDAMSAMLAPDGRLVMIHEPRALGAILAAFGATLGAVAILPIHPRANASARRVLVAGRKGSRAPLNILPGLILHDQTGAFTAEAEAIHRGDALISLAAR